MSNMKFEKYHGCGNDFLIVENENLNYPEITRKICNRNTGFGADGLIVAHTNPLRMMLYNQDGSVANMCGNGIRTLACYYVKHNLNDSDVFTIGTLDGLKTVEVISKKPFIVKINMGNYSFDKDKTRLFYGIFEPFYRSKTAITKESLFSTDFNYITKRFKCK